jgi:hypothetical protein|tara:strand:- start:134 stop:319 length:186 start_codon:yes stop_codon:yes gene_type:complete
MTKGFDIDGVDVELPIEDMTRLLKKYKKLKKYRKSTLHTIQKLSGKKTIIDELEEESKDFE